MTHYTSRAEGCPGCGARQIEFRLQARDPDKLFDQSFQIVECRACALCFVDPLPNAETIRRAYEIPGYYGPRMSAMITAVWSRFLLHERVRRVERYARQGRILDVGCGDGSFLAKMSRRGWEAYGVEVSRQGLVLAQAHSTIRALEGPLTTVLFPHLQFDVVTFWQTLEHMGNPREVLEAAKALVKASGVLIVTVPNWASWEGRWAKDQWFHLDVPRHVLQFTPQSLIGLLEREGWSVAVISHWSWEQNLFFGCWQSWLNMLGCETNFMYRHLKRHAPSSVQTTWKIWGRWAVAVGLFPPALLFTLVESVFRKGPTMMVVAKRSAGI